MPVTGVRGRQILDGDVFRNDLNVTSSTQAVTARIIAGTNISIASSNGNMTGTGDVTINVTGVVTGSGTGGVIPIWSGTGASSVLSDSIINYSGSTLQINSGVETYVNIRGTGQGYTHANIVFQTGTNTLDTPSARGLGTYYFNEGNDVLWFVGNAYGGANTDTISFIRLSSATFNGAASDPNVGTRLFYIDVNKSVFANQIQSSQANNSATGGGQIYLNGATGNRIDFNVNGVAPPTTSTRSAGTKIVLYPLIGSTAVDYALGIDSGTLWYSVPLKTNIFKWYGETETMMQLSNYNLIVGSTSTYVSRLTVYTQAAGQCIDGIAIATRNDSAGSTHITRIYTDTLAGIGIGRSLIYAASYNTSNTTGQLDVLIESGGQFLSRLGIATTGTTNAYSLFSIGGVESFRFDTDGNSWINGGNNVSILGTTFSRSSTLVAQLGGGLVLVDDYLSPIAARLFFGDGTGWSFPFSKRMSSVTTDLFTFKDSGQLQLNLYTATSSFTGTLVGYLGFTSSGDIITIAAPSGSTQWITSGNDIYYSTGNVSIGTSTFDARLRVAGPINSTQAIFSNTDGRGLEIKTALYSGTNEGSAILNVRSTVSSAALIMQTDGVDKMIVNTTEVNAYETFYARKLGAQIQLAGGVATASGIYQAGNNFLYISDWATGSNGIVIDVSNGVLRTRASAANGAYIQFERSTSTIYGYVGNSSGLIGTAGYNANTALAIRSEGDINFATSSTAIAKLNTNGRLTLATYNTTASHTGTAVGILAFDSSGNILTIATPSGTSQWTTNGSDIYYLGEVGIGVTSPQAALHISTINSVSSSIRFERATSGTWEIGLLNISSSTFSFYDQGGGGFNRLQLLAGGQIRFNNYTATSSFTGTAVGVLAFDSGGNILTIATPTGASQWTTNGNDIHFNTGNVGIGATTPLARLHFSTALTSVSNYIRFTNPVGSIYAGQVSNINWFEIGVPSGAVWMQLQANGRLRLNQYTAFNSFVLDAQGVLAFDTQGNIHSIPPPIYRHSFLAAAPINATPTAGQQFFNNSNSYITKMDLTGKKRIRLLARVTQAGIAGCLLRVRYRTAFSTTITDYLQMGASEVSVSVSATGVVDSGWISLVAGAQADVFIALQTISGDGNQQITIAQTCIEIED